MRRVGLLNLKLKDLVEELAHLLGTSVIGERYFITYRYNYNS